MTLMQIQEALAVRQGGMAKIWEYQVGHQWLTILITAPGIFGNFHLKCGACDRAEFDTSWSPSAIKVERTGGGFLVHDGEHLRVICGAVEGAYNVEPYLH